MPKLDPRSVLFSVNCFAAAMAALFIALAIGLPRPYWAMATVYIVSQPLSGAVRSKALYRLVGTLIGGAAAVVLVPNLVDDPALLSLAIGLWVAGCLTVSLFDRSPRSYLMMLSGYTCAIIGFPSVNQPGAIFEVASARVLEIGLGILCATAVHSFVFPSPVGGAVRRRLSAWLAEADHWLLDLTESRAGVVDRDRRHLAAAANEIRLLTPHLPFDTSPLRDTTAAVQAIQDRMLLLIPLLSGASDRLAALGGDLPQAARDGLDEINLWLKSGADGEAGRALAEALRRRGEARLGPDWTGLLTETLLVRLSEATAALAEAHALAAHLADPYAPASVPVSEAMAEAVRRPLHGDIGLAFRSGAACLIAMLIACALWIGAGWADGAVAAMMVGVFCAMFASQDDPGPAIASFGLFTVVGVGLAWLYLAAVLPAIDGYPVLALALFPPLFLAGAYMATPRHALKGLAAAIAFLAGVAVQESFDPEVAGFINANLSQFVGIALALVVTRLLRSLSAEASVQRLLRRTWAAIGRIARHGAAEDPAAFAATLIDRIAQLTPKLSSAADDADAKAEGALQDLRVAMSLMNLQQAREGLGADAQARIRRLSLGLADHYAGRAGPDDHRPPQGLLAPLDAAIRDLARLTTPAERRAVVGLVSLRRNLFPAAPAPMPAGLGEAGS